MTDEKMRAFRTAAADWKKRQSPENGTAYRSARLLKDQTGMEVIRVHYPAGSITPPQLTPAAMR